MIRSASSLQSLSPPLLPLPPKLPSLQFHALSPAAAAAAAAAGRSYNPIPLSFSVAPRLPRSPLSVGASASNFAPDSTDILGDITVFTSSGEPVLFKDLWDQNDGVAVVALLRHFGCFFCWELASSLKEYKPKFDSTGVKLIAVGVGTPDKAQILGDRLPFPMDCLYADPDRKAYNALGLYYGLERTLFNPAKLFSRSDPLKKAMKNYTIGATPDDLSSVFQQGGMFVFKGKQLLYARKDERPGDHAPLDDIFEVCCTVPIA